MAHVGELLKAARSEARLSMRALARRAQVADTTIARIESGTLDPTVTTFSEIMAATGNTVIITIAPITEAQLSDLVVSRPSNSPINWTQLRAIVDRLTRHPSEIPTAIINPPLSGRPDLDALLAGVAEKLADDHQLRRPRWTETVPALDTPWEHPGTERMREHGRRNAPSQLRLRNIHLAENEIWRL